MPIAATLSGMQAQIKNAFSLDIAASKDLKSTLITTAIASCAPSGVMAMGAAMIPLAPGGFSGTQTLVKNSCSMDVAANKDLLSTMMASAISVLCPIAPPAAFSALQAQLKQAYSLQLGSSPDLIATMIASAVISYYTGGGGL